MFRTLSFYEEGGLGLPYAVTLVDAAEEEIDDKTGEVIGISVPDMEGLAAAVAIARVLSPIGLLSQEVRFLRDVLDMGSAEMAEALSMDASTYSRWENGKQSVGQWADKQIRLVVVTVLQGRFPHFSIDPKTVVSLKPVKARIGQPHPDLRMVRRPAPVEVTQIDEWDTLLVA